MAFGAQLLAKRQHGWHGQPWKLFGARPDLLQLSIFAMRRPRIQNHSTMFCGVHRNRLFFLACPGWPSSYLIRSGFIVHIPLNITLLFKHVHFPRPPTLQKMCNNCSRKPPTLPHPTFLKGLLFFSFFYIYIYRYIYYDCSVPPASATPSPSTPQSCVPPGESWLWMEARY